MFLHGLYQSERREASPSASSKSLPWLSDSLCSILNMSNHTLSRDSPSNADKITLHVGERCFTTTHETLAAESGSLLSGRWDNAAKDDSYFVDADANFFEHILRYLRRGVFPFLNNLT